MENHSDSKIRENRRKNVLIRFLILLKYFPLEAVVWILGLMILIFISPGSGSHFTFCVFNNIGLDFCPGCGLGKSISFLFRGDITASFDSHPLGLIAIAILSFRVYSLIKKQIQKIQSI